jgi:hypothetical protein
VFLGVTYVVILQRILEPCLGLPVLIKMVITLFLIAPLAFCMGMPFPLGLAQAGEAAPDLLPWAWGINGCASVLSSILATILAMHYGFRMVVVAAVLLYVVAAGLGWRSWSQATLSEEVEAIGI